MPRAAATTSEHEQRPVLWVFALFAAGLLIGREAGIEPSAWWFAGAGALALASLALRGALCRCAMAAACVTLGAAWWAERMVAAPRETIGAALAPDRETPLTVEGVALTPGETGPASRGRLARFLATPDVTRFELSVAREIDDAGAARPARGTLLARIDEPVRGVRAGDRLRITGLVRRIDGARNPGQRDPGLWAAQERIAGWLSAPSADLVVQAESAAGWGERARARVIGWRSALRERARSLLGPTLDLPASSDGASGAAAEAGSGEAPAGESPRASGRALLGAMLLGERSDDLREVQRAFTRIGLAHVIAISGMNLTILAAALLLALRLAGDLGRLEPLLVGGLVAVYLVVVPAETPVVRAGALTLAWLAAESTGRRYDRLSLLALVALGVLIWRPLDLWSPGFQLSFGVVGALLAFTRPIAERWFGERPAPDTLGLRTRIGWWARDAFAATVVAWAVASPCIAFHFGVFSPLAVPATLLLGPPVTAILALGYLAMIVAVVFPSVGEFAGPALEWASAGVTWAAFLADGLPGTVVSVPRVSGLWAVAATLVIVWWLRNGFVRPAFLLPRHSAAMRARFAAAAAVVLVWLGVQWRDDGLRPGAALRLDTFDVGDGTCHLLRARPAHGGMAEALLWDCGASSLSFGERVLRRAVWALGAAPGIARPGVATAVVTHPDIDHYGSLLDGVEAMGVRRVIVGEAVIAQAEREPAGPVAFVLAELRRMGVEVRTVAAGDRLAIGAATIEFLSPARGATWKIDNDASLVARVTVETDAGPRRLLLCGDVERAAIEAMEDAGVDVHTEVMEAPHHGSATPSGMRFVEQADPGVVVQSTGRKRAGDERWDEVKRGRRWLTTAIDGAVWVEVGKGGEIGER